MLTSISNRNRSIGYIVITLSILVYPYLIFMLKGIFSHDSMICYLIAFILFGLLASIIEKNLKDKNVIQISRLDFLIGVFLVYGLFNALYINVDIDFFMIISKWGAIAGLYILCRILRHKRFIFYLISLNGVIQSIMMILQTFYIIPSDSFYLHPARFFSNPGISGGHQAIALAITICLTIETRRSVAFYSGIIFSALISYSLYISDSRAAWIAFVFGLGFYLFNRHRNRLKDYISDNTARLVVSGIIVLLTGTSLMGLYYYKQASADGRILIWKVTAEMIAQKPLMGHGAGSFGQEYLHYQAKYFSANPTSKYAEFGDTTIVAFNEFLYLTAELGVLGLALVILLLFLVFFVNSSSKESEIAKCILMVILLFSLFSYPFSELSVLIIFALSLAIVDTTKLCRIRITPLKNRISLLVVSTLMVYSVTQIYFFSKKENQLKQVFREKLILSESEIVQLRTNPRFWLAYSDYIIYNGSNQDIINTLQQASHYIPSTILYTELGNAYKRTANYAKAIESYTLAHHMTPNRILPLYNLFQVYRETGDLLSANQLAIRIKNHKIKTYNSLVINIKSEIENYLTRTNQ